MAGRFDVAVLIGAVALIVGACADDQPVLDGADLVAAVSDAVSDDLGQPVTGVRCPPFENTGVGFTLVCDANVGGADTTLAVTLVDPETGEISVENREALVELDVLEADIERRLSAELDDDVEARCGSGPLLAVPFDGSFECQVRGSGGAESRVLVDVGSNGTDVAWRLDE